MAEPLTNPSERSGWITDTVDPLDVVPSALEALPAGTVVAGRRVDLRTPAPRMRTWMAVAILATIAAAAVYLLVPAPEHHRFARLLANGDRGMVTVGTNGARAQGDVVQEWFAHIAGGKS